MRGSDIQQGGMFSYVSLESRVPAAHPLRGIKALPDEALADMTREFNRVFANEGRPSIPPERLVRASTLQILYSIRCSQVRRAFSREGGKFAAAAGDAVKYGAPSKSASMRKTW